MGFRSLLYGQRGMDARPLTCQCHHQAKAVA